MSSGWPAPRAESAVDAVVRLPGSKSVTNRALVLAALSDRPVTLRGPLHSRDTLLMLEGLRAIGVGIDTDSPTGQWRVAPSRLRGPATVDCGLAGTVMRFLPPVAGLATGDVRIDGDPEARVRPMRPMLAALRELGCDLDDGGSGTLPVTVRGRGGLTGGRVSIDASASSQFVSGLLLSAPRYAHGVEVVHAGAPMPSRPHLHMTVAMLRAAGADVDTGPRQDAPDRWRVSPGPLQCPDLDVEPDLSNAAPFLAAALVTGGRVHVPGWPLETTQPGARLPALLSAMGASVTVDADGLTLTGSGRLTGLDADLRDVSELTPVLAVLAALADSPSRLSGVAHMRGHETDRLSALRTELNALGADVTELADGLTIRPRPLHGGVFSTYHDHRMATAAALVGLVVDGVRVENVETTAKTMPGFVEMWDAMLAGDLRGAPGQTAGRAAGRAAGPGPR